MYLSIKGMAAEELLDRYFTVQYLKEQWCGTFYTSTFAGEKKGIGGLYLRF